jgi:hypothetical protein
LRIARRLADRIGIRFVMTAESVLVSMDHFGADLAKPILDRRRSRPYIMLADHHAT